MRWRGWRGCCNWEPTVSLFVFPEVIVICLFLLLWQDIMAIFGSTLYRFCLGRASQIVIQSCPFWMSHHLPTRSWHVPRHPNPPTITPHDNPRANGSTRESFTMILVAAWRCPVFTKREVPKWAAFDVAELAWKLSFGQNLCTHSERPAHTHTYA